MKMYAARIKNGDWEFVCMNSKLSGLFFKAGLSTPECSL
jgi:hypothetical protein